MLIALALARAAEADLPDFTDLVRRQTPAVVSIAGAYATPPVQLDAPAGEPLQALLEQLGQGLGRQFEPLSLGSGFIVSTDGDIVTAYHIVQDAPEDEVIVRLADGRELPGRVVGMDRASDIALVKVAASGLPPPARIGDPARLQPGEWVVTIGAPFGFERSVAAGVVSATMRQIPSETHIRFIQSDVAMNPGHSGGPLFNLAGEVIGVNSMIFSASGGSIGLSFAVPIDVAMLVVARLRAHGAVRRGRIGVQVQELSAELARAFGLAAAEGALVTAVESNAPAERAGLRAGDVVIRFGATAVRSHGDLVSAAADAAPGSLVTLELIRLGALQRIAVRVAAQDETRAPRADARGTDRLGFRLAPLSEPQRRRRGVEAGLAVQRAEGAARRAGLLAGDLILSVNGQPARSPEGFRAQLEKARPGDSVALLIERGGSRAFVPLRIP